MSALVKPAPIEGNPVGIDFPEKYPYFYPGYVPQNNLRPPFFSYREVDGKLVLPEKFLNQRFIPFDIWYDEMITDRSGKNLTLLPWVRPILQYALTPGDDFKLPFQTVIFSGPKKQTKTSTSAYMALWFAENMSGFDGDKGEIYIQANAVDHAKERAFGMIGGAIQMNPFLEKLFPSNYQAYIESLRGVKITPVANDPGTVAGCNNELVLGDEIWALITAAHKKVWAELTPTPSRYNSMRWVSTYAGYEGESEILEELYKVGMKGEPVPEFDYLVNPDGSPVVRVHREAGLLMYWDHVGRMPYHQSPEGKAFIKKQRFTLPSHQYLRLWENRWAKSHGEIPRKDWERVVDPKYFPPPETQNKGMYISIGVDAGTKRDRSAVAWCFRKEWPEGSGQLRVCKGGIKRWDPSHFEGGVINLEHTIEEYVKKLALLFNVRIAVYDPSQMVRVAEEWKKAHIDCKEYKFQSEPAVIELGNSFMDMLRGREIVTDDDTILEEERMAVQLVQSDKGYKLMKAKGGRNDSFIAFALACHGARTLPPSGQDLVSQFMFLGSGGD